MGIFDWFKFGKKQEDKKGPAESKAEPKGQAVKQQKKKAPAKKASGAKAVQAHRVLVRPLLSEKATLLASQGKYMFQVEVGANKNEIRKSIESVYDVNVERVNIISLPGKERRYGRSVGRTPSRKKAVVTLAEGQKIPGFIEAVG